jgi:hypothetical protein
MRELIRATRLGGYARAAVEAERAKVTPPARFAPQLIGSQ